MKKLLCLIFAAALAFSFAACGNTAKEEKSDFEAFMEVQKNMQNIRDLEFDMLMDISSKDSEDMSMILSGTGREVMKSKDDIQMEMDFEMKLPGTDSELPGIMYMKDQAVYMDMMGQKLKVDASNEMAAAMNIDANRLLDLSENMISDLSVTEEGSDTIYTLKLNPDRALSYFQKNAASPQLASLKGISFSRMDVTVAAGKDNMAKRIKMDCAIAGEEDDILTYTLTMKNLKFNTDLKIDFPDFREYQELTV